MKQSLSASVKDFPGPQNSVSDNKRKRHPETYVKISKITKKNSIDLLDSSRSILSSLLGVDESVSLSSCSSVLKDFKEDIFQSCPAVFRDNNISAIKESLFHLNIQEMLENTASESIHVWLQTNGGDTSTDDPTSKPVLASFTVEDSSQARILYSAGHSLYCRVPAALEKAVVPRLLNELGIGIGGMNNNDRFRRGEIETFFSRKGHITRFHSDFQENFTIQLSGTKRWTFADSSAVFPLRGCTPHFFSQSKTVARDASQINLAEQQLKALRLGDANFRPDQFQASLGGKSEQSDHTFSVDLHPGDVLYHPAGVWHQVECLEDSIAINISLIATSFADIFCSGLQQLLLQNPNWRKCVRFGSCEEKNQSLVVMQSIIESLPVLSRSLIADDFLTRPSITLCSTDDCIDAANDSECVSDKSFSKSSEDTNVKDFSEETESEDSDAPSQVVIDVADVDIVNYLVLNFASSFSNSGLPNLENAIEIIQTMSFRMNPLVQIISMDDINYLASGCNRLNLETTDANFDAKQYTVNCCFGNETLDSVSRVILSIPKDIEDSMALFMALYRDDRYRFASEIYDMAEKMTYDMMQSLPSSATKLRVSDLIQNTQKNERKEINGSNSRGKNIKMLKGDFPAKINGTKLLLGLHKAGVLGEHTK